MRFQLCLIALCLPLLLFNQEPVQDFNSSKGLTPVQSLSTSGLSSSQTYAVVLGISDYQNSNIPDLRFADQDAKAFSEFLRSPSGGSLDDEHLRVLINEEATMAQFAIALDWLMSTVKEGDKAIIYFSGHGDVEKKTMTQPGFLLCWDAPAKVYMAGGTFALPFLQDIISTLSIRNKANVLVITDACHSGKLAGSSVSGTRITGANLAKQFAGETKILSCQPDELSLEGEQWGGGRGLFSYHLVEGLYGEADQNGNKEINLLELGRHLEDNVMLEATSSPQTPVIVGPKATVVARVNTAHFKKRKEQILRGDPIAATTDTELGKVNSKEKLDKEDQSLYELFYKKIKEKQALETVDSLFIQIETKPAFASLLLQIKQDYAAALQDEVQQALNALLESDPGESNKFFFSPEKYHLYPAYIQRSIDLLGPEHYSISSLQAKKYFFKAYDVIRLLSESDKFDKSTRDSLRLKPALFLDTAIHFQPDAAYLYFGKMLVYGFRTPSLVDSIQYYQEMANDRSPEWLLPYLSLASEYIYNTQEVEKGKILLEKAYAIDPQSYIVIERLIWLSGTLGETERALALSDTLIQVRPDLWNGYGNKGSVLFQKWEFKKAIEVFEKAIQLESDPRTFVPQYLGYSYFCTGQIDRAIQLFQNILKDERTPYWRKADYYSWFGKGLVNFTRKLDLAEEMWDEALERRHFPHAIAECLIMKAKIKILKEQFGAAEKLLNQAFENEKDYANAYVLAYALRGMVEANKGNIQAAETYFKKGADYPGDNFYKEEALFYYGDFFLTNNRIEEASQQFQLCKTVSSDHGFWGDYGLAKVNAKKGETEKSLSHLKAALVRHFPHIEKLKSDPLFKEISQMESFKE